MRHQLVLLSLVAAALFSSNALSASTDFEESGISTVFSRNVIASKYGKRVLRAVSEDDDKSEERGGRLPGLTDFVKKSKAKISSTLSSTQKKVAQWAQADGSVDDLKVILKLNNKVTDDAFMTAKNYKLYDQTVTAQLPVWSKNGLTPDDVLAKLGIAQLSEQVLARNPNYKYYLNYIVTQVPIWTEKGLAPKDVLKLLRMESLSQQAIGSHPNFKYYDNFVSRQTSTWVEKGLSPDDVRVLLGVEAMSKRAFEQSPNFRFYFNFMGEQLKAWRQEKLSLEQVQQKLGMAGLPKKSLKSHLNYQFLAKYAEKDGPTRIKQWLKKETSTSDVWSTLKLESGTTPAVKSSGDYKLFTSYVLKVDDKIALLQKNGEALPSWLSKIGTSAEMAAKVEIWATAGRNKEFVKFALGMDKLDDVAFKQNAAYKYYKQFLKSRTVEFHST